MAQLYGPPSDGSVIPHELEDAIAADLADTSAPIGGALVQSTGTTSSDVNHTTRIDSKAGRSGLFIRNEQAKYALKVDQYDTNGTHDAVNIASNFPGAHTPLGIVSGNTDFSTVKVTNTAAQVGGAIYAGVGDNPARTASIFGADNFGRGSSFVSSMKAGSTGVAFRAAYDPGVYSTAAFWATCHHASGDLMRVENDGEHTSGAMLRLRQTATTATTPAVWIENAGTGETITAPNFNVLKDGRVKLKQIESPSSFSHGAVQMSSTGTQIERGANDANPVLKVRDTSTSGTGDLVQIIKRGGVTIAKVTPAGDIEFLAPGIGIIQQSPNGTRYRITVGDDGTLGTAPA